MLVGVSADDVLGTLVTLELLGLIYLAIAVSRLRARIAYLEGLLKSRASHDEDEL